MMKEQLQQAGLTGNESTLYLALLDVGPSNAGLISRKSGLHRRVVYDTLEMLIQKGLVGYMSRNGVRLYQASHPKRLVELLQEKEHGVSTVMDTLVGLYGKTKDKDETTFYKGKPGLKTVFEDQRASGKDLLILGGNPEAYALFPFYFKWFDERRKKQKMRVRLIVTHDMQLPKLPLADVRVLPQYYTSPLAVNIYGKKVALLLWHTDQPLAIVIKNERIAEGYWKHFELIWKVARNSAH